VFRPTGNKCIFQGTIFMTDIDVNALLSELSRKERKYLLMTSAIGVFVSWAGVVPTRISTLGIELNSNEQRAFLLMLAFIIVYFLLAFVVYGFRDFIDWRIKYHEQRESETRDLLIRVDEYLNSEQQLPDRLDEEVRMHINELRWAYKARRPVIWLNVLFEFAFPIIVSSFSIVSLVTYG
jgi:hypothetical protein